MAPAAALLARAMHARAAQPEGASTHGHVCMPGISDENSTSADRMLQQAMGPPSSEDSQPVEIMRNCAVPRPAAAMCNVSMMHGAPVMPHTVMHGARPMLSPSMIPSTLPQHQSGFQPFFHFQAASRQPPPSVPRPPPLPFMHRPTPALKRGIEPASASFNAATVSDRMEGPGLEAAYEAAPPPDLTPPIITMIKGRFYKPQQHASKRRGVSAALKRAAATPHAYSLARDSPVLSTIRVPH